MPKIPFSESELAVSFERPAMMPGFPPTQEYTYPVPQREGVIATMKREPIWQIMGSEVRYFAPAVHPDNVSRASVMDGTAMLSHTDGPDMFGVEWEFVKQVGGCMVRPGNPMLKDANDWEDIIKFPDIAKWDWASSKAANAEFLNNDKFISMWLLNGFFERLISFMEFENAAYALIDEDQTDAVKALLDKLADFYITLIDESLRQFPRVDGFFVHDDWGSQRSPFFSPDTAMELIVPPMKKVTDYIHSRGRYAELHSCGCILQQVPSIIAAGWDMWSPQLMNDTHNMHEMYGDKLIIGIAPTAAQSDFFKPNSATEAEDIAAAKSYVQRFCRPEKPSMLNMYSGMAMTTAYRSTLYKESRLSYGK